MREFIRWSLISFLGKDRGMRLCKLLALGDIPGQLKMIADSIGLNGLREAYRDNLIICLKEISKLVSLINGNIIVTSDHGELLGEANLYEHHKNYPRLKPLIEVPLLLIKKALKGEFP